MSFLANGCGDFALPGGSTTVGPNDYVQDGLVAIYDAGYGAGAQPYKINGSSQIELKAVDSTLRRWTVRVPVKSCKDAKARHVFVKCTVLGGALDLPILTNFIQPFKAVKE